jgi:hypothetical protein
MLRVFCHSFVRRIAFGADQDKNGFVCWWKSGTDLSFNQFVCIYGTETRFHKSDFTVQLLLNTPGFNRTAPTIH